MITEATLQLSAVIGADTVVCASQVPASELTDTSAGQEMVGNSISVTVTSMGQLVVFPDASVAVHVTVVVPRG